MIAREIAAQLVCALCFCLSCTIANADLSSAIAACESRVTDENDGSFDRLADVCPDLVAEIQSSRWNGVLGPAWRDELSYWELSQLAFFDSYYQQQVAASTDLPLAALDDIVASLNKKVQQAESVSLWDRFVEWLKGLFNEGTAYSPDWLSDWLSKIRVPGSAVEAIFWLLCVIIVVAAIVVVAREIKATRRASASGEAAREQRRPVASAFFGDRELTLQDVDTAGFYDKPSLLLRLILQRLEKLGVLTNRPAYTHREAHRAASLLPSGDAKIVSRVSESAERIRFGAAERREDETRQVVAAGITLFKNLKPERS